MTEKLKQNLPFVILLILFCIYAVKWIAVALTSTLSFDGAMNVQVAQSLASDLRYATTYNGITDFDHRIQTGLPVLLPAALLLKIFGATSESALMTSTIFMIFFALVVLFYLNQCAGVDHPFLIAVILMIYGTPAIFSVGSGLLGEIPALSFFILALIFLNKYLKNINAKYLFLAGISLGLSFLVKTVLLIVVPALLFAALFDIVFIRRYRLAQYFRDSLLMVLGAVIPIVLFEFFKLSTLGYARYVDWWRIQLAGIYAQAGVTEVFPDTANTGGKIFIHLDLLSEYTGLHPAIIVVTLLLLLTLFLGICFYAVKKIWIEKQVIPGDQVLLSSDFLVLLTVTLSYFGWWLLITPTGKAWYRRIFNGILLLEIVFVIVLYLAYAFLRHRAVGLTTMSDRLFRSAMMIVITIPLVLNIIQGGTSEITFEPTDSKEALVEVGDYIQSLPDSAKIFGYGWWQAPLVAYESGKEIFDITRNQEINEIGAKDNAYFVIEPYVQEIGEQGYLDILRNFQYELVYSEDRYQVYQLLYRYPYASFTEEDFKRVGYSHIDFTTDGKGYVVRNVYFDEPNGGGKWAQEYSGYLLKYAGEKKLRISIWVHDQASHNHFPYNIKVSINNRFREIYLIDREGSIEINVPLTNLADGVIEISLTSEAKINAPGDPRNLALFLQKMELLND